MVWSLFGVANEQSSSLQYNTTNQSSTTEQFDFAYNPSVIMGSPNATVSNTTKKEQQAVQQQKDTTSQAADMSKQTDSATAWNIPVLLGIGVAGFVAFKLLK